jgi:hypothetical protein
VFPEFAVWLHGCDAFPVPPDWCRYAAIDPGRQVCAVVFLAVPPPDSEHHGCVFAYDELYIQACSAALFGERMRERAVGQQFEAFLIDAHGSRLTDIASGLNVNQQYSEALKAHDVRSRRTGAGFIPGAGDVQAGIEAVRGWLRPRDDRRPYLKIFRDCCPNLVEEFKRYRHKMVGKWLTDEPETRGHHHAVDCLRYLALFKPQWHRPKSGDVRPNGALAAWRAKQKRQKDARGHRPVVLGPKPRSNP